MHSRQDKRLVLLKDANRAPSGGHLRICLKSRIVSSASNNRIATAPPVHAAYSTNDEQDATQPPFYKNEL
uniref:Uncharacterized protein n=1 Tax=Sphaerodactylus townsendi TaxID=933632 RepID=A0ACB8F3A7_9SAUR